jgi:hypothetical protein
VLVACDLDDFADQDSVRADDIPTLLDLQPRDRVGHAGSAPDQRAETSAGTRPNVAFDRRLTLRDRMTPRSARVLSTSASTRGEENIPAADIELTPEDLAEIENGGAQITPQGARYPESSERMVDR